MEYTNPVPPSMVEEPEDTSPLVLTENSQVQFPEEYSPQTIQNTPNPQKVMELLLWRL